MAALEMSLVNKTLPRLSYFVFLISLFMDICPIRLYEYHNVTQLPLPRPYPSCQFTLLNEDNQKHILLISLPQQCDLTPR